MFNIFKKKQEITEKEVEKPNIPLIRVKNLDLVQRDMYYFDTMQDFLVYRSRVARNAIILHNDHYFYMVFEQFICLLDKKDAPKNAVEEVPVKPSTPVVPNDFQHQMKK